MSDAQTEQPDGADDAVRRAADRRIRAEALRLLERVRPSDDDDWRLESLDPAEVDDRIDSAASAEGPSSGGDPTRTDPRR